MHCQMCFLPLHAELVILTLAFAICQIQYM